MKKIVPLILAFVLTYNANAQLVDVINEAVASPLLAPDYTAYRIYARLQDPTDRVSAVFGSNTPSPIHHLIMGSSNASPGIFNHQFGDDTGDAVNCGLWGFFADAQWDSYVTFNHTNSSNTDAPPCTQDCVGFNSTLFTISTPPGMIGGSFNFTAGPLFSLQPDLTIIDGAWFTPNDGSCGASPTGPDNRVLIAQVTVPTGTLVYWLNISIFDEALGANQMIYVHEMQDPLGDVGGISELSGHCLGLVYPFPGNCDPEGCIDPVACNYSPFATIDDGSCVYPGCTDSNACNYDPTAGCNDGSCTYSGCTDNLACNYDADAGCDDGSCGYSQCGCTDPVACNYDVNALYENETCAYPGCTDSAACNYDPAAGCDDGSCFPYVYENDFCEGAIAIAEGQTIATSNELSCLEGANPCGGGNQIRDVWFSFVFNGTITISTATGTLTDTRIAIYGECGGAMLYCDDDSGPGAASSITVDCFMGALLGNTYYIQAGGWEDLTGTFDISLGISESLVAGCTDVSACNYDWEACIDNGNCNYGSSIYGTVYQDSNGNGSYDGWNFYEPALSNWPVKVVETGITVYTDANGVYVFPPLPPGTYTVEVLDESFLFNPLFSSFNATVPGCTSHNILVQSETNMLLSVSGPCCIFSMNLHCQNGFNPGVYVHNIGSEPLYGTFTISCDEMFTGYNIGNQPITSIEPGLFTWTLNNQPPGTSLLYQCHVNGPGVEYLGQVFPFDLNLEITDGFGNTAYTNTWTLDPTVVCAYDPNDKYAVPEGYSEEHYILEDGSIEYRIRFQNTGNAPAENILIADSLDLSVLDIETFNPLFASANFSTCLHDDGLVEFLFDNIMLPDSASDEPGSQGYVVFNIRPVENIPAGTEINNTAYIYFDGNPPVITNTTWHTIFDCTSFTGPVGDTNYCAGETAQLSGEQLYVENYSWTMDGEEISTDEAFVLTNLQPSEFNLQLNVANPLCDETNSIEITVHELPQASAGEDEEICLGEEVTLLATGGETFNWNNGLGEGAEQTFTPTENDSYEVTVTNEFDCEDSDEVMVAVHPLPAIDITENGITLTAPDGTNWQWYDGNGILVGAVNQVLEASVNETYYVITTNEFGCISTSEMVTITHVENGFENAIVVFPNPVGEILNVNLPDGKWNIKLTNEIGQAVYEIENYKDSMLQIERRTMAVGNYLLVLVNTAGETHNVKLVFD